MLVPLYTWSPSPEICKFGSALNRLDHDDAKDAAPALRPWLPLLLRWRANDFANRILTYYLNFGRRIDEKYISNPSTREVALDAVKGFRQTMQTLLNEALTQERRWTAITIVLVALSVILILVGALAALFGYAQAGTLTSISSVITSAVSILLFQQLKKTQENTRNGLKVAEQNYRDAMKQLNETEPKR